MRLDCRLLPSSRGGKLSHIVRDERRVGGGLSQRKGEIESSLRNGGGGEKEEESVLVRSEHTRAELQSKGAPGAGEGEALIFPFSPLIHFSRKRGGEKAKIDPFLFLCVRMCVILVIRLGEKPPDVGPVFLEHAKEHFLAHLSYSCTSCCIARCSKLSAKMHFAASLNCCEEDSATTALA